MYHAAPRAIRGTLLFRTWPEARALWDRLIRGLPRFRALILMPDHVHVILPEPDKERLGAVMRAYAQWRNAARGERVRVWEHGQNPSEIADDQHLRRTERYVYLNPCRKRLVDDPLAWPFSSYRDALGFVAFPSRAAVADPYDLHAYVSADSTVDLRGTFLPQERTFDGGIPFDRVRAAVSSLTRTSVDRIRGDAPARHLLIRASRALTGLSGAALAREIGVHHTTVLRTKAGSDPAVRLVARVAGDPRFSLIHDGDVRAEPTWRSYATRR
jgi:hypothetical protein